MSMVFRVGALHGSPLSRGRRKLILWAVIRAYVGIHFLLQLGKPLVSAILWP